MEPLHIQSEWMAVKDPNTGKMYYANIQTRETTWSAPPEFDNGAENGEELESELEDIQNEESEEKEEEEEKQITEKQPFLSSMPSFQKKNQALFYDQHRENNLIKEIIDIIFNFDDSNWKQDKNDETNAIYTYHKMISDSQYCTRGESRFNKKENIMNFYNYLINHKKCLGFRDVDKYQDMRQIDNDHVFLYHKPTVNGILYLFVQPRDYCVIRT
eukprot:523055_1